MSSGQSVLYNETALDKYEYRLIFREQMMEIDLGKERFPTLADAVDEIIRMASGTGRMDMDGETLGDASFPRMVFFSYGDYIIGEAVLENAELELDKDLRPIRETYLFDKDTVAVHFIPMPCKEFSRQWDALWKELDLATLYDYLCYLPVEFCRSRFYPAGRKNEIYLLPEAGGSAINQDELNSMALKICNAVNRSDMPGLG